MICELLENIYNNELKQQLGDDLKIYSIFHLNEFTKYINKMYRVKNKYRNKYVIDYFIDLNDFEPFYRFEFDNGNDYFYYKMFKVNGLCHQIPQIMMHLRLQSNAIKEVLNKYYKSENVQILSF